MKYTKHSPGFSLILSLTMMAAMVMLVVTISAFVTVESRMAMNQQLTTRARLNAIVSMRLALAHLQQEAGPDRRATARADITQPEVIFAYKFRNPMWTGVWRSDFPDLPPAWLISGRADQTAGKQSVSLFQTASTPTYPSGYWAPWHSGYNPGAETLVPLVGTASAAAAEGTKPSGLVSLPKITLPDDDIAGSYAYWIGDEGIKARINLREVRSEDPNDTAQLISIRSPVTQGILKNLINPSQLDAFTQLKEAPLLSGVDSALNALGSSDVRKYFHDITTVSSGVLADSLHGGLKRDLSLAFELSDDQFAKTEFGQGAGGSHPSAGTMTEKGVESATMKALRVFNPDNTETTYAATPIFSRTVTDGQLRGPTWWALRDYHRLYKQLGWSGIATGTRTTTTPSIRARPLWPNVDAARPAYIDKDPVQPLPSRDTTEPLSLRRRYYGYSDTYNGDLPPSINPNANDQLVGHADMIIPRPLRVAATPYVQRVTLAFSVNKTQWFVGPYLARLKGKWYWVTEEHIDIRVNVTPIVVLHNPYNVRMVLAPNDITGPDKTRWHKNPNNSSEPGGKPYKQPYSIAISFADLAGWKFRFKQYSKGSLSSPTVCETPLSDFFRNQSGIPVVDPDPDVPLKFTGPYESDNEDTFRLYLTKDSNATITLEPGEMRIFSCPPAIGDWSKSVVLDNTYDTRGGFCDNLYDWNFREEDTKKFDLAAPIAFEIIPGGNLRMRTAIAGSPKDQLYRDHKIGKDQAEIDGDKEDFLRLSSELNEVIFTDINQSKYPSPGEKFFQSWRHVKDKYPRDPANPESDGRTPYSDTYKLPLEPDLVTVIDIAAKTADTPVDGAPFPLFSHSNPLAPTQRASSSGRIGSDSDKGAIGASPSYQLNVRSGTWTNVIANSDMGRLAYGGNSSSASGTQKSVLLEVPLFQPVSLAQYAHANFGVRDQQPLLSIGNSFASPLIDATKQPFQDNGKSWTDFDQSYLLNAALWDSFFLSSAAPQMNTSTTIDASGTPTTPPDLAAAATILADPNEKKSLDQVIDDFVKKGTLLDNPRFSIEQSNLDATDTVKALLDYRRSASVLMNKGAFNVNSTSVTAWQSLLGSAKKFAIADIAASSPGTDKNARFPRTLSKGSATSASGNYENESNWSGFANLTDSQINNLAKAIVDENKVRFGLQTRSERDQVKPPGTRLFDGLTKPATPYLGLSEFINRFLSEETWSNRCGALQAAIFRADQNYNAGLSDRLVSGSADRKLIQASLQTATAGYFSKPENIEVSPKNGTSGVHTAMGAPGNLLQSDLLQSLGSALTTRSDTFTLRCFGEAAQSSGETGSAWMEVVVQRVPEFIDSTNVPETGNSAPRPLKISPSSATDASISTALTKVNNVLGRRFKVVSMRWLKADEI